jgi:YrbI family 3-deoxy-D-manno-octulosonate 8-phosphate phosphatase
MHARRSQHVGAVYVSTDSVEIADVARAHGAEIVIRPEQLSDDSATSESALVHVLDTRRSQGLNDPDLVVFLQCTSPVRAAADIDGAVARTVESSADSLFSACRNELLVWGVRNGAPISINYDYRTRKREQDMEAQFRENGSIYVFKPRVLREHGNRLGGRIEIFEMDYWSSFQVDKPEDVELINWILCRPTKAADAKWPSRVDLVVFDFDGVMTDNKVEVCEDGRESVRCNRADGLGIDRLRALGVPAIVVSTERNSVVAARCAKLQLEVHQGIGDKAAYLKGLLRDRATDPGHVAYVGNDENDLGCMKMVGLPVAVADTSPSVLAAAAIVLRNGGGNGAVREFADLLVDRYRG